MYNTSVFKAVNATEIKQRRHNPIFICSVMYLIGIVIQYYLSVTVKPINVSLYDYIRMAFFIAMILYELYWLTVKITIKQKTKFKIAMLVLFSAVIYFIVKSGILSILRLTAIILLLLLYKYKPLNGRDCKRLYYLFIAFVAITLLNGTNRDAVSEQKINPNLCGLVLTLLFCISLTRYAYSRDFFTFIMIVVSAVLQFVYSSRTAMLGSCIYIFLFLICSSWRKTVTVKKAVIWLIVLNVLGIVCAYIYSEVLFKMIGHGKIVLFNKDLFTGRQMIWELTLSSIRNNFLFGVGSDINLSYALSTGRDIFTNPHNQPLGILASYGIFYFIIFYIAFAYLIVTNTVIKRNRSRLNRTLLVPIIFMTAVFVMSYFEAYLFYAFAMSVIVAYILVNGHSRLAYVN